MSPGISPESQSRQSGRAQGSPVLWSGRRFRESFAYRYTSAPSFLLRGAGRLYPVASVDRRSWLWVGWRCCYNEKSRHNQPGGHALNPVLSGESFHFMVPGNFTLERSVTGLCFGQPFLECSSALGLAHRSVVTDFARVSGLLPGSPGSALHLQRTKPHALGRRPLSAHCSRLGERIGAGDAFGHRGVDGHR